jgi:hypothetical protein
MKKIFYSILLCVTALAITSCNKHNIEINDLIGKWERSEITHNGERTWYESITFEENGVCHIRTTETLNDWEEPKYDNTPEDPNFPEGELPSNVVGASSKKYSYRLDGNILYLTRLSESTTTAYIVSIKKNTLKLTNAEEAEKMKPEYVTSTTYTRAN